MPSLLVCGFSDLFSPSLKMQDNSFLSVLYCDYSELLVSGSVPHLHTPCLRGKGPHGSPHVMEVHCIQLGPCPFSLLDFRLQILPFLHWSQSFPDEAHLSAKNRSAWSGVVPSDLHLAWMKIKPGRGTEDQDQENYI
jgi:hypothetical protein